jgi:hypothetical protein
MRRIAIAVGIALAASSRANLFDWGEGVTPLKWGATIKVWIQPDPTGAGRDIQIKQGIERWIQPLAVRGKALSVRIGTTDAAADEKVKVQWRPDGYQVPQTPFILNPPNVQGMNGVGSPNANAGNNAIGSGNIDVRNSLPGGTTGNATENARLQNVAEHEMGHVLGLADDNAGNLMTHNRDEGNVDQTWNARDKTEFNSLYGTANTNGGGRPGASINPSILGPRTMQYRLDYIAANPTADAADPEHLPMALLNINPDLIDSIDLPPGWIALLPRGPTAITDRFYTADGYMDQCGPIPLPYAAGRDSHYIALRMSDDEALADGLPPSFDASLSPTNSSLTFTLHSHADIQLGVISAWAGGDNRQFVVGPVPEPATLASLAIGGLLLRRKMRYNANG